MVYMGILHSVVQTQAKYIGLGVLMLKIPY